MTLPFNVSITYPDNYIIVKSVCYCDNRTVNVPT